MDKSNSLVGIVVLYNPEINEVIENIYSYIDSLDRLYCIDNSEEANTQIKDELIRLSSKILYEKCNGNIGLAKALIKGCELAGDENYRFVLLLDQDSFFAKGAINKMRNSITENNYALITPTIKNIYRDKYGKRIFSDETYYGSDEKAINQKVSIIDYAITSGSIIRLDIYSEIDGFDNKLFISQIDNDYCCRVAKAGYKMIRVNDAIMYQEPGRMKLIKIHNRKYHIPNLSSVRYYYLFRNEYYLRKKNGNDYKKYKVNLLKYIVCIIFFEKEKFRKLKYVFEGLKKSRFLIAEIDGI